MRYASVAVGIVDYLDPSYRESGMRLRYAASDASAFHRYLTLALPSQDGDSHHVFLNDRRAGSEEVAAAFASLAAAGEFDLFILYLSGHGELGANGGGWFCLADAVPGAKSLGGAMLDELLSGVSSRQVLVVVDCCHAEAAFSGARYFTALGRSHSRLLIASSRADQRSWEDDTLGRSIFSDVFLRGCSNESDLHDASGMIDVETALIPYLREQVVLLAAQNKGGQVQEPVSGGVAATPFRLRSVNSQSFGRPLSLAQALRGRLRRVLVGIGVSAIAVFLAVHLLTFHIVAGSAGQLIVRHGLNATSALLPAVLVRQIDSGFALADIDPTKSVFLSDLSRGAIWGIESHQDDLGLNGWAGEITPFLKRTSKSSYDVLVRGQIASFDSDRDPAPIDEALFVLARAAHDATAQISTMYPLSAHAAPDCASNPANTLDFSWLNPTTRVVVDDALWSALRTPARPAEQVAALRSLVERIAYRRVHNRGSDNAVAELSALAQAASLIGARAAPRTMALIKAQLRGMLEGHCQLHASLVLGLLSNRVDGAEVEEPLRRELLTYDRSRTGDVASADQELAAAALEILVEQRPLSAETVDAVTKMIRQDRSVVGGGAFPHPLLLRIAEHQALPRPTLALLSERSDLSAAAPSFEDLGVLRVLARNARFLSPPALERLLGRLAALHATSAPFDQYQEALGFVALASPPSASNVDFLIARLSPSAYFPTPSETYRGDMLISVNADSAAVALGRVAQVARLEADAQERLARLAIARPGLPSRHELIAGLAHQWFARATDEGDAIEDRLLGARADAGSRALAVEVACVALVQADARVRVATIHRLLERWKLETGPEMRTALALIVGRAHLADATGFSFCAPRRLSWGFGRTGAAAAEDG